MRRFRDGASRLDYGYDDFTATYQRFARQIGNGGEGCSGQRLVERGSVPSAGESWSQRDAGHGAPSVAQDAGEILGARCSPGKLTVTAVPDTDRGLISNSPQTRKWGSQGKLLRLSRKAPPQSPTAARGLAQIIRATTYRLCRQADLD
jgi:hypothetical protein